MLDKDEIKYSDYTTVADAADEYGVTEEVIRQWIRRNGIKAVGMYPDRRKIFLRADIGRAEEATRDRAPLRNEPTIAHAQRRKRPHLTRRHKMNTRTEEAA